MARGFFITFEGLDGSGKSTQIAYLREDLEKRGYPVVLSREPGGTPIGERIRKILLDPACGDMTALTEALLFAASRAQHAARVIRPALAEGKIVICDRYLDSSIAYQAYGRGLGSLVRSLNEEAVRGARPDLTIYLAVPAEDADGRVDARAEKNDRDRIEDTPEEFRRRVQAGFEALAEREPGRIVRIDGAGSRENIRARIRAVVDERLREHFGNRPQGGGGEQDGTEFV